MREPLQTLCIVERNRAAHALDGFRAIVLKQKRQFFKQAPGPHPIFREQRLNRSSRREIFSSWMYSDAPTIDCVLRNFVQDGEQFLCSHGLRQVIVHSRREASFFVALHRVGGHGHDGDVPAGYLFFFSDGSSCFPPVHFRHLHVHQYDVEDFLLHCFQCLPAVCGYGYDVAVLLQQSERD